MNLYNKQGDIVLKLDSSKEITRGGEGMIFMHPTNPKIAIKVYHSTTKVGLSEVFVKELSVLGKEFIRPNELFYNYKKQIAGFSMGYLSTNKLYLFTDLASKSVCLKEGFSEIFKVKVLTSLRKSVDYAHDKGIVIGDLNPYNIFFSKQGEVYFIDTDSYQTASKVHSGVMLPEIRDWTTIKINSDTDNFAYAILAFQASTFLHPYKGIHPKYKSLEERVVKHLSLLSGDKSIITPGFYEPLSDLRISDQFKQVFQADKRFVVDITGLKLVQKIVKPIQAIEGDLIVKTLADNILSFGATDNFFYFNLDGLVRSWHVYECVGQGSFNSVSIIKADKVYSSRNYIFASLFGRLHNVTTNSDMDNIRFDDNCLLMQSHGKEDVLTIFDPFSSSYQLINLNELFKNQLKTSTESIFVPSVFVKGGAAVQTISGQKWLLCTDNGILQTIRTSMDILNVHKTGGVMCLETKLNGVISYNLARQDGLDIEIGPQLDYMPHFAVGSDIILVPADGKISVYSMNALNLILDIDCKLVTEQSVLKLCKSGILCQTDDRLYLINKKDNE